MHFSNSLLLALSSAAAVQAHSTFTTFFVDGVSEGDGVCVRTNTDPAKATFPVEDLTSNDMVCGFDGTTGVSRVCSVKDASTLTFQWRDKPNVQNSEAIDPSHKGPCAVYLKKVDNAKTDSGIGDGWFKIWDEGYDEDAGQWCTEKLIANHGYLSVKLPENLQGGYYLARPELLALHAANQGDPQFYIGCAQIFIESDGNMVPDSTVSMPGYVQPGSKPVSFNIYESPMALPYPIPGPKPADYKSGAATTQHKMTVGKKPAGCILESGNWCGYEVKSYTDETGCWNANEDCWNQDKECWDNTPVSGGSCKIWETKCKGIEAQCKAGNFNGPPNKGKSLTPDYTVLGGDDIDVEPTVGGGSYQNPAPTSTKKTSTKATSTKKTSAKPTSTKKATKTTKATAAEATSTSSSTKKHTRPHKTYKTYAHTATQAATKSHKTTAAPATTKKPGNVVWVTEYETDIVTVVKTVTA